jgi:cytochrome c biogenesis protein ResB
MNDGFPVPWRRIVMIALIHFAIVVALKTVSVDRMWGASFNLRGTITSPQPVKGTLEPYLILSLPLGFCACAVPPRDYGVGLLLLFGNSLLWGVVIGIVSAEFWARDRLPNDRKHLPGDDAPSVAARDD